MMSVYYCNNFTESYAFIYSGSIEDPGADFKLIMWHNENQTILQQDCASVCGGPFQYGTFEYSWTSG